VGTRCLIDPLWVDYTLNELMRPTYEVVQSTLAAGSLGPELQKIRNAGLTRNSGRIYLRYFAEQRKGIADGMDQWTAERWVNEVHIESFKPASDPAWRADVLAQAVLFVTGVLPGFTSLARRPVQAVIGLQSASGRADPDIDYPVGSVHLYQLGQPGDDARLSIESFAQPVLVVTSDGT
jgi:hypothetical protein